MDHLRGLEEEHGRLKDCQQDIEKQLHQCNLKLGPVCTHLIKAKACTHLHPYLTDNDVHIYEPNPAVPHPTDHPAERGVQAQYISIGDTLQLTEEGHWWLPHPWYHDKAGTGMTTSINLVLSCCIYCTSTEHTLTYCPDPHFLCSTCISCIVPTYHCNNCGGCPSECYHFTDLLDADFQEVLALGGAYTNVTSDDDDYGVDMPMSDG